MSDLNLEKYLKLNEELDNKTEDIITKTNDYLQQNELKLAEDLNPKNDHLEQVLANDFDNLDKKIQKSQNKKDRKVKVKVDVSNANDANNAAGDTPKIDTYGGLPESTKNLPPASQNRLLLARLSVLDKELEKQLDKNAKISANLAIANDKLKDYDLTNSSNNRKIATLTNSENKLKNQVEDLKKQLIEVTNNKVRESVIYYFYIPCVSGPHIFTLYTCTFF